jgi:hypothetical protein
MWCHLFECRITKTLHNKTILSLLLVPLYGYALALALHVQDDLEIRFVRHVGAADAVTTIIGGSGLLALAVNGTVSLDVRDGCQAGTLSFPSAAWFGDFAAKVSGASRIESIAVNTEINPGFLIVQNRVSVSIMDSGTYLGEIIVHGVATIGGENATVDTAAFSVVNKDGEIHTILVVGADTGLAIGGSGVSLNQDGGSEVTPAYSGMVMFENVISVNGIKIATGEKTAGFLAGLSMIPQTDRDSPHPVTVNGAIFIELKGAKCEDEERPLDLPQKHNYRTYRKGPQIIIRGIASVFGPVSVLSDGASCLSDFYLQGTGESRITGNISVISNSLSSQPGGIVSVNIMDFK